MVGYEKPTVTRLGTLAELTLTHWSDKAWGGSDGIVIDDISIVGEGSQIRSSQRYYV